MSDDKSKVVPLNPDAITPAVLASIFQEHAHLWQSVVIIGIDGDGDVCLHSSADALEIAYLSQAFNLYAQSVTVGNLGTKVDNSGNDRVTKIFNEIMKEEEEE